MHIYPLYLLENSNKFYGISFVSKAKEGKILKITFRKTSTFQSHKLTVSLWKSILRTRSLSTRPSDTRPNDQHGVTQSLQNFPQTWIPSAAEICIQAGQRGKKRDMLENPRGQGIQKRARKNAVTRHAGCTVASSDEELDEDRGTWCMVTISPIGKGPLQINV